METKILESDDFSLEIAANLIRQKELVAFPTDTVFGLGAQLFSNDALLKLFHVKKRPLNKPINILISNIDQVKDLAKDIPREFYQLADKFFPGALTIVLKKHDCIPSILNAGYETVGIRMPNSAVALKLLEKTGPLAVTSVNLSGEQSCTSSLQVLDHFNNHIAAIIQGECLLKQESTILSFKDLNNPTILREGVLKREDLEFIIKRKIIIFNNT